MEKVGKEEEKDLKKERAGKEVRAGGAPTETEDVERRRIEIGNEIQNRTLSRF